MNKLIESWELLDTEVYKGKMITVPFMGPDLLCYVDWVELPNFHINVESAKAAGRKYIDRLEAENV